MNPSQNTVSMLCKLVFGGENGDMGSFASVP